MTEIRRWRELILAVLTVIVMIWLQPDSLRWVFPILSVVLVAITWLIVSPAPKSIAPAILILAAMFIATGTYAERALAIGGLAFGVGIGCWQLNVSKPSLTSPPDSPSTVERGRTPGEKLAQSDFLPLKEEGYRVGSNQTSNISVEVNRKKIALYWILTIAGGLLLLKTPVVAEFFSQSLRLSDLEWLGISYIALRLIAVLIDFRAARLPSFSFLELLIYTLFPLTILAGPIDRAQRFVPNMRAGLRLDAETMVAGGRRVVAGLFKKFVVADTLALIALSPQIAADTHGAVGAWVVVYIYAFQIYLDFAGYTDIVIGLGRMIGFELPENFNAPYLKPNLSRFWQNWHMTLTNWLREYVFLPMSRHMLRADVRLPAYLVAQTTTMLLIGFWHGVTVNFALWGMWHVLGFVVQRWFGSLTRRQVLRIRQNATRARLLDGLGILLTFHYVAVGWVFFALPEPEMSFEHLRRMFIP